MRGIEGLNNEFTVAFASGVGAFVWDCVVFEYRLQGDGRKLRVYACGWLEEARG